MIDLKILDVFSTLFIGIFTLVLIGYFYFLFNKLFIGEKFNQDAFWTVLTRKLKERYTDATSGFAVVTIIVIYILGLFTGDLTDHMTDSDEYNKSLIIRELNFVSDLNRETKFRNESLINTYGELTGLGKAVFNTKSIVERANKTMNTVFFSSSDAAGKQWRFLRDSLSNDPAKKKDFEYFLGEIYYTAKNWCYSRDHEPLVELKQIQNRIDLSRSIILLCALAIQILVILLLVHFTHCLIQYIKNKKLSLKYYELKYILFLVFLLVLSKECYRICEINYNKRVFGYYVSYIKDIEDNVGIANGMKNCQ